MTHVKHGDALKAHCAICRPGDPWSGGTETCCAEHEEIARIAEEIRKGTATGMLAAARTADRPETMEKFRHNYIDQTRRLVST